MTFSKRLFTVYIDLAFLRCFLQAKPDPLADSEGKWPATWQDVFAFLRKHAHIVLDAREHDVIGNDLLVQVLMSEGRWSVEFEPGIATEIAESGAPSSDDPFALFMLEEDAVSPDEMEQKTGLLFLRHKNLAERWPMVFQHHTLDVHEGAVSFHWRDIGTRAQPLNAVVVVDKYAYHQLSQPSIFERNLGGLLLSLLPSHARTIPVHVTIVTDLEKAVSKKQIKVNELHDTVRSFLDRHRNGFDIRFSLVGLRRHGHEDRIVFTNYGAFMSGDSFDFFGEDGSVKKDTMVTYLPIQGHEATILRRLRRFGRLCANPRHGFNHKGKAVYLACGDQTNRLLERTFLDEQFSG
jgi:hypothetical protein